MYAGIDSHDKAIEMFERGRILFEELEDVSRLVGSNTDLGYCYLILKGQVYKSLKYVKTAKEISKDYNNKNIGLVLGDLAFGCYYSFIGNHKKGDNYLKKSIENSIKTEIQGLYSLSSRFLAESLFLQGQYEESLLYYKKAYELAIQTDMILWNITSIIGMGINRKKLGLEIDYDEILQEKDKFYKAGVWYEYYYDYLQYQLFEEDKYLNSAYAQLNDITKKLNEKDRKKLLNCPWPKMIMEEWEKNNEL